MKVLSESELRAKCLATGTKAYYVQSDVFVTPGAKEYLRDRNIELIISDDENMKSGNIMPKSDIPNVAKGKFVDAVTGEMYDKKPENMTHLYGNVLVSKNHPRIFFRGKLDSLSAEIIKVQVLARESGYDDVADNLQEVLDFTYSILGAEVNERAMGDISLLGYDADGLRYATHHMTETFGFEHTLPHYRNGKLCAELNRLRTLVREAELYAVKAFDLNGVNTRNDIVEAMNRLSSCIYIIYCRALPKR